MKRSTRIRIALVVLTALERMGISVSRWAGILPERYQQQPNITILPVRVVGLDTPSVAGHSCDKDHDLN